MPTITFLDDKVEFHMNRPTGRRTLVFYAKAGDSEALIPFTGESIRGLCVITDCYRVKVTDGTMLKWTIKHFSTVSAFTVDEWGEIPHTADTATWETVLTAFRKLHPCLADARDETIELFVRSRMPSIAILCDLVKARTERSLGEIIEKEIAKQKKAAIYV